MPAIYNRNHQKIGFEPPNIRQFNSRKWIFHELVTSRSKEYITTIKYNLKKEGYLVRVIHTQDEMEIWKSLNS